MNDSLLQYCKAQLAAGYSEDQIREALLKKGWASDEVIEQAKQNVEVAPKPEPVNPIAVGINKAGEPDEPQSELRAEMKQTVAQEQLQGTDRN